MRLDRMMTTLGLGSRSEVQRLIRAGQVTVNGATLLRPETQVEEGCAITVSGAAVDSRLTRHILLHKPSGVLTAARDARQQTVMDLLPPELTALGCMPVGRLDRDTTGLLLLTTDGELNHRLLSPRRHVDKRYHVWVDGPLDETHIAQMAAGIELSEGVTAPAMLEILSTSDDGAEALLTIHEGRFHQVKRMFEAMGRQVTRLHRDRFGPLALPDDLPPAAWRELTQVETEALYRAASLAPMG